MAKRVSTWWHPTATANRKALAAEHDRQFPGNALSELNGYIKVSYPHFTPRKPGALSTDEVAALTPVVDATKPTRYR